MMTINGLKTSVSMTFLWSPEVISKIFLIKKSRLNYGAKEIKSVADQRSASAKKEIKNLSSRIKHQTSIAHTY